MWIALYPEDFGCMPKGLNHEADENDEEPWLRKNEEPVTTIEVCTETHEDRLHANSPTTTTRRRIREAI